MQSEERESLLRFYEGCMYEAVKCEIDLGGECVVWGLTGQGEVGGVTSTCIIIERMSYQVYLTRKEMEIEAIVQRSKRPWQIL